MPRNITVTFGDGSSHVYQNAPDTLTPQDVAARAASDFGGKAITNIDGGNPAPPAAADAAPAPSLMDSVMGTIKSAASSVAENVPIALDNIKSALTTIGQGQEQSDAAATGTPMPPPVAPRPDIDTLSAPFQTPDSQKTPAQLAADKALASKPAPTFAVGVDQDAAMRRANDTIPQGTIRAGYNVAAGQAGKTLANAMTTAGEAVDSEGLRTLGRQYQDAANLRINRAMQGNEDSDSVKTVAGVFSLAPLLAGGPGVASMVTQAGVDGYADARQAGDTPDQAITRGTAMALANYVGLRTQLPGLTGALTKAVSGAPAGEAVAALGHALTTNVGGMEATTVLGDLYDKLAPGGLKPDMSADDMVHDIAATAKSAALLTLAVPGVPLAAGHLFGAAHALAHGGQGNVDVARAIDGAPAPAADAAPTTSTDNTAAAPPVPTSIGLDTLHDSIDEAARTVGLTPNATVALRNAAAQQDPQKAPAFIARALHGMEARGLTTKPGAPGAFRDALAQRLADQQPDEAAAAPAAAAGPSVADQLTAIRPLEQPAAAPDAAPAPAEEAPAVEPAPITPEAMAKANDIAAAAHQAATSPFNETPEPTDAQKAAGNYAMGHVQLHGLDITVENPQGSVRSGVDPDGKPWSNEMAAHYGYIKGTHASDGDHVDTFIGPNPESKTAYVIDQVDPTTGKFDEPKTILGADSEEQARQLYAANYADGWNGLGAITPLPMDAFKAWVRDGVKSKPLGDITQWKPTDERAQPDVAVPSGVPAGAGDVGGGPAVASGGDLGQDAAVAAGRGVGGDAAAPAGGAGATAAVDAGGGADAALKPDELAPRLLGKPVDQWADEKLAKIVDSAAASTRARDVARAELARRTTGTPEFKKWFGDSKVVDENGEPQVMFHGTSKTEDGEAFSAFDSYASEHGLFGQGSYFTDDPKIASDYTTKGKGKSPTVYPVHLSIKNPIDMDAPAEPERWRDAYPDQDLDAFHEGGTTNESWFRAAEDAIRDEQVPKWEGAEMMQEGLRKMGYDGITHIGGGRVKGDGTKHRVYIAFDPEQVKSATGNRGTFDPTSADIRTKQSTEPVRTGVDPTALRAEVSRIQAGWKDAPPVHVVDDADGLPKHIQDSLQSQGAEGKTQALLMPGRGSDPGDVYLIANRLKDVPTAQFALFHEVLGHYGIRKVLGSDAVYSAEMYKLRQANPALASEAEAWMQQHGRGAIAARMERGLSMDQAMKVVRALSTEEALADRAGRAEPIRGLQSLMAKIQTWLRSVGLDSVADRLESMTQAETAALLARARSTVEAIEPSTQHGDELASALSEPDDKSTPLLSQQATDDEAAAPDAPKSRVAEALGKVREAGAKFADTMKSLRDDALLKVAPMALGTAETRTVAKDFANADRLARWQWGKFDDVLKKNYDEAQRRAMWEAGDQESVLRQQGKTPGPDQGLNRLTPDERKTVETLQAYGDSLLKRAKDVGMFQGEGLPSWTPRMAVLVDGKGEFSRPKGTGAETGAKQGRNIVTSASSLKARKYLTAEDTEAAMKGKLGDGAQLVRDIRTMPLAMARLERAIAGRELVNQIKAMGDHAGLETVSKTDEPGFFTVDHPAFKTWQVTTDEDGTKSWEAKPLYVNKAFQGPLKAVMSETPGPVYSALMSLKAKSMGLIMYSPLIHNAVEWGRALPAMPGKVATFQIYFEGNRIKNDPVQMRQAINDGLVPIGKRGGIQDITGIMEDPSLKPGRSWTAKLIGGALGLANEKAGTIAKKGIDAAGDIWHNTLLWDRVGDLQAGLYGALREKEIAKGTDPAAAGKLAAHFANRFAGALPNEAMSAGARKVANILMFSRTFTLGNMGLMKDMVSGLPRDIQSQIRTASGDLAAAAATSRARRIAIASFIVDIGLMYVGNSVLQSTIEHLKDKKSWGEIGQGYLDRLHKLLQRTGDHPLETLSNPFDVVNSLSATSANEPGKEDRVRVGTQDDGTAIYLRLPTGKVGEDFKNWITKPLVTAKAKESQLVRPLQAVWTNDNGIGQRIYDPDAKGLGGVLSNAGRIAKLFATQAIPADAIQGALDWKNGKASDVDKLKVAGPLAGLTFSKGAPGGPAVGQMYDADRRFEGAKMDVMPDVKAAIKAGDDEKAIALLEGIKMRPSEIMRTLRHLEMPESRLSAGAFKHFAQHASDDDMERMNDLLGAEKTREAAPAQP